MKYLVVAGVLLWSLSSQADAAAPNTLNLSGTDWRIHEDADGQGAERGMFEADISLAGWIPATVPGNIQADLEAAQVLKPLWYGAGDPRLHEVARKDWWYRKDFVVPQSFDGQRLVLVFDGVDHECEVWLNGRKIGGNAGMFRRFDFDVAGVVRPGQVNRLAVRIARIPEALVPVILGADAPNGSGVGNAVQTTRKVLRELKSPTNGAWDWSVAVYTLGIWKDVRLEATGPARIEWLRVRTALSNQYQRATVKVDLEVDSLTDLAVQASFRIAHRQSPATQAIDVSVKKGQSRIAAEIPLEHPALWWPHGHGEQPLYELQAELTSADSDELWDRRTSRFGVREIRWEQCPGAPADFINPLKLVVNGRPVRQLGSNLLPPDALFGRSSQRGPRLIELAREAGINCLRLWGGGVILPDDMYDRADELGIMFLQEFPLANCRPETDPVSLANLEATITNIVKQIRNHPCIVEWDGGNEMAWKNGDQHPALQLLERIVREQDDRIFRATEPAQGSGHHGSYTYMIDYDGRPLMNYDFVRQALAPVALSLKYDSLLYDPAVGVKAELFLTSDAPRNVAGLKWRWTARDRRGQILAEGQGTAAIEPIEVASLGAIELKPPGETDCGPLFIELRLEDSAARLLTERLHVFGPNGVAGPLAGLLKNGGNDSHDQPAVLPPSDNPSRPATGRPVRRTTLQVEALPLRPESESEVFELQVKNAGAMTALFCEPHPLIAYRTDLFVENNHGFIPPGESRTITIRAAISPRPLAGIGMGVRANGLSLRQTGWWISCWNADSVTVEPSDEVLLAVGRRDQMCREFLGYFDPGQIKDVKQTRLQGTRPDPSLLPYVLDGRNPASFEFPLSKAQAERPARLRIHAADQSKHVPAEVEVTVNGRSFQRSLPKGLGIQNADPAHLAFPATLVFEIPSGVLRDGRNGLEVRVKNDGWFTWDALDLISNFVR